MRLLNKIGMLHLCSLLLMTNAEACTRFTYTGSTHNVITARSMDWVEDMHTDLWAFPAGMTRQSHTPENAVVWTSQYGSVIASGYDMGTTDGLNTQGLAANLLYLSSSDYGPIRPERKNLSVIDWAQYALDHYATVAEAVQDLSQDQFNLIAPALPNGMLPTLHLSLTDRSGDNAIFEYQHGKLKVYHDKAYTVMTNEPSYDKQLALNEYWQNLKGAFLPGTSEPSDRFVRASYYLSIAPQGVTEKEGVAIAFSVIRNTSVPIGVSVPGRPNVAATFWRSAADLQQGVYYFENTDRPNVFWVDLKQLDLRKGASPQRLLLQNEEVYAGDASHKFIKAKPVF